MNSSSQQRDTADDCPESSQLAGLLDGTLAGEDHDRVAAHLETCSECQNQIERLLETTKPQVLPESSTSIDSNVVDRLIDQLVGSSPLSGQSVPPGQSLAGRIIDDYEILTVIDSGGTGVVYRAVDQRLGRTVAMKVLRSHFSSSDNARTRLEREARATANLQHPNIVRVYDVKIDPVGVSYLVMELVDGGTLKDRLTSVGKFDGKEAAKIVVGLLAGLQSAHDNGLVHRDLKCSNVLIDSQLQTPKLTDFGLVRELDSDSQITRDNVIAGTPAYMCPEQILAPRDVDARSDVYSAGVILYELLSGELPFRGTDRMVLQQVVHELPPPLRRIDDGISRDLETISSKALSKKPDARYESAQSMLDDLQRYLDDKPIKARPIGLVGRLVNWAKRNRTVAALLALSASLLVLLAIGSTLSALSLRSSSLESKRQSMMASRQRDELLETVRRLVFDVNELLEPSVDPDQELDIDQIQIKLLNVAVRGLERMEKTGQEFGLHDFSSVAAKNRLGDAYYRLEDLTAAKGYYLAAQEAMRSINPLGGDATTQQQVALEQLRTLEGLASIAMHRGEEQAAEKLQVEATRAAERFNKLSGEEIEPAYFFGFESLSKEKLASLESSLQKLLRSVKATAHELEVATEMTQQLLFHYSESKEFRTADQRCRDTLDWLKRVEEAKQSEGAKKDRTDDWQIDFELTRLVEMSHVIYSRAMIAEADNRLKDQMRLLRQAIRVLPKGEIADRFTLESADVATSVLRDLVAICEPLPAEAWMMPYFRWNTDLTWEMEADAGSFEGKMAEASFLQFQFGMEPSDELTERFLQFEKEVEYLDTSIMDQDFIAILQSRLKDLKRMGLGDEDND